MKPSSQTRMVDLFAALPDLGMAAFCLVVWIDPMLFGPQVVRYIVLTMLLEFIVVHSAAFMGSVAVGALQVKPLLRYGPTVGIIGLGAMYSLFVLGFCLAFKTWWPMAAFWLLTINRLLGVIIGQGRNDAETKQLVMGGWAVGAMAYLFGAFFTTLVPLPRLGIDPGIVNGAGLPGEGLWIDEPWRAVVFGMIYFGLIGWYELRWRACYKSADGAGTTPG